MSEVSRRRARALLSQLSSSLSGTQTGRLLKEASGYSFYGMKNNSDMGGWFQLIPLMGYG